MQRHRHQEFIRFLKAIEAEIPSGKIIHVVRDNYGSHRHSKVRAWLDRHPRFVLHYTPKSAPWLNVVEGFFANLNETTAETRRVITGRPPSRHKPLPR